MKRSLKNLFCLTMSCMAMNSYCQEMSPEIMLSEEKIQEVLRQETKFSQESIQLGEGKTEKELIALLEKQIEEDVEKRFPFSMRDNIQKEITDKIKPVKIGETISYYVSRINRKFTGKLKYINGDYAVIGNRQVFLPDNPALALRVKPALYNQRIKDEVDRRYTKPRKFLFDSLWKERAEKFFHKYAFSYNKETCHWEHVSVYLKNRRQQIMSLVGRHAKKTKRIDRLSEQLTKMDEEIESIELEIAEDKKTIESFDGLQKLRFYVIALVEGNRYEIEIPGSLRRGVLETTETVFTTKGYAERWCFFISKEMLPMTNGSEKEYLIFSEASSEQVSIYQKARKNIVIHRNNLADKKKEKSKIQQTLSEEKQKMEELETEISRFKE